MGTWRAECQRPRTSVDHAGSLGVQCLATLLVGYRTNCSIGSPQFGSVKAAPSVLSRHGHLESVPKDWQQWHPTIRKARPLSVSLFIAWDDALLFRELATLRRDLPVFGTVEYLRWRGPTVGLPEAMREDEGARSVCESREGRVHGLSGSRPVNRLHT